MKKNNDRKNTAKTLKTLKISNLARAKTKKNIERETLEGSSQQLITTIRDTASKQVLESSVVTGN